MSTETLFSINTKHLGRAQSECNYVHWALNNSIIIKSHRYQIITPHSNIKAIHVPFD